MILYTYFPAEPCGPQQNWGEGWTASPLPSPCGGCLRSSGVVLCFCTECHEFTVFTSFGVGPLTPFSIAEKLVLQTYQSFRWLPHTSRFSSSLLPFSMHSHIKTYQKKSTSAFRPNKKANPYGFQNVMNKDTCPENFSALSPPASQIASSETRLVSFRSGSDLWIIQISYENLYWGL